MAELRTIVHGNPEFCRIESSSVARRSLGLEPRAALESVEELQNILVIEHPDSRRLIIPTIELFSRCFGSTQYVKRILATLPFEDALRTLIARDRVPEIPGKRLVTVGKGCKDGDGLFLSHLKYDDHIRACVRRLSGGFQSASVVDGIATVTPDVLPWWSDGVPMLLHGVLRNDAFIVLRIDGMGHPSGPDIQVDRQNSNRKESDEGFEELSEYSTPITDRNRARIDQPKELVHAQEPSADAGSYEIQDDPFWTLGEQRAIEYIRTAQPQRIRLRETRNADNVAKLSAGDVRSGTDRPALAIIHAPSEVSSPQSFVKNLWCALAAAAREYPKGELALATWTGSGFTKLLSRSAFRSFGRISAVHRGVTYHLSMDLLVVHVSIILLARATTVLQSTSLNWNVASSVPRTEVRTKRSIFADLLFNWQMTRG